MEQGIKGHITVHPWDEYLGIVMGEDALYEGVELAHLRMPHDIKTQQNKTNNFTF